MLCCRSLTSVLTRSGAYKIRERERERTVAMEYVVEAIDICIEALYYRIK